MIPLLSQIPPAPPAHLNFPTLDRTSGLSSPRETNQLDQAPRDRRPISFEDALDRAAGRRDRLATHSKKDSEDHGLKVEDEHRDRTAEESEGISSEVQSVEDHLPEEPESSPPPDSSSNTTSKEEGGGEAVDDAQQNTDGSTNEGAGQGGKTAVGAAMGIGAGEVSSFIPGEILGTVGKGNGQQTQGNPVTSQSSIDAGANQTQGTEEQQVETGEMGVQNATGANREVDPDTVPIEIHNENSVGPEAGVVGTAQVVGESAAPQNRSTNHLSPKKGAGQETRIHDSLNSPSESHLVAGKGTESGSTSQDGQSEHDASGQSKANILKKIQFDRVQGGNLEPAVNRASEVEQTVRLVNTGSEQGMVSGGQGSIGGSDGGSLVVGQVTASVSSTPVLQMVQQSGDLTTMLAPGAGEVSRETMPAMTQRVVRGMSTLVNQHGGVLNMRLSPPELGDLKVQMTVVRNVVMAQFQATTPEAHAVLEKSITALRTSLESQGLTVERLSVHLNQSANTGHGMTQDHGEQSSNQERQNAGGGASRGHREGMEGRQDESQDKSSLFSQYVQEHEAGVAERANMAGVS